MGKSFLASFAVVVVLLVRLVASNMGVQVSGNKIKSLSNFSFRADPSVHHHPGLLLHLCYRDPVHSPTSIVAIAPEVALSDADMAFGVVDLAMCAADLVGHVLLWCSYPNFGRDPLRHHLCQPPDFTSLSASPCTTNSLKLNNNSLLPSSLSPLQQQANFGFEEDAQEYSTDSSNKIFGSVEMKKPASFLDLSNRRLARSLPTICSSSPLVCSLTGVPSRDFVVIPSSVKDLSVIWLL
ncbi:unnamed protein product [Urochloa humidicola]